MERELLGKALAAISATHKAFGAPGDYGYGTREGDALFNLSRVEAELHNYLAKQETH